MKSDIFERDTPAEFPRLMKYNGNGGKEPYIIMETSKGTGVVVWSENDLMPVGYSEDGFNTRPGYGFERFYGDVILNGGDE